MTDKNFMPVTIDMIEDYREYLTRTPRKSADYTFTNLWGWAEYYGLSLNFGKKLCWIRQNKPLPRLWAPVGDWHDVDWEEELRAVLPAGGCLHRVPEELAALLKSGLGADRIEEEETRGQWEYLYSREELATLSGNKFHKKKNHVNAFRKLYGEDYRTLDIRNPDGIEDVLGLQEEWCRWRDCESSPSLQAENDVIFRVVGNWARLSGLMGGALYVENKMAAFSIGEALDGETLVVHFEKVQPDYKGVYQAINNAFARHVEEFRVLNREQDLDEEGLRQAKETYNPMGFLKKSKLVIKALPA